MEGITENPCYDETLFFVDVIRPVIDSKLALDLLDLFAEKRVAMYGNSHAELPQESPTEIAHLRSTLFDAVNFAYLIGYETVGLIGVDLYDRRYFWLEGEERRVGDEYLGANIDSEHNTTSTVLEYMPQW